MSNKAKMRIFMSIVAVVTVLALLQGFMADGSRKVIPFILGAMGAASLMMWTYAIHSYKSNRK
ncbi:hypothetical protein ABZ235_03480 [Streptomyces canus]|uniref:hypothetical protein n=1 Tax=Streptomyces canus TaxID=58343 RepID=UPI00339DDA5B